jgi:hypothetical protein
MRAALVLFLFCLGCGSTSSSEPAPHITPQPGSDKCAAACAHMSATGPDGGCDEAQPVVLKDGGAISCSDFCIYQQQNGVYWNTACLLTIKTCDEIETVCNTPPDSGL